MCSIVKNVKMQEFIVVSRTFAIPFTTLKSPQKFCDPSDSTKFPFWNPFSKTAASPLLPAF